MDKYIWTYQCCFMSDVQNWWDSPLILNTLLNTLILKVTVFHMSKRFMTSVKEDSHSLSEAVGTVDDSSFAK